MNTDRFNDDSGRAAVPDDMEILAKDFNQYRDSRVVDKIIDNDGCKVKDVYTTRLGYFNVSKMESAMFHVHLLQMKC